ncbi:MAG: Rpn family recombination-promoting nuclease/putative transposase [Thermoflexibacter sp.]
MSKVNPKIDLVFKKLFGSEENKDILLSLINAILPLDQQVAKITLKNPYNVSDYAEGKLSILDIKAQGEDGRFFDIEMQIRGSKYYGKRALFYWAKIFGSQLDYVLDESQDNDNTLEVGYSDLKKCIVISLMDFNFFDDKEYYRFYTLKDGKTNEKHKDLDYLDLYFIELKKYKGKLSNMKTTLERWITFLNNAQKYDTKKLPKELAEIKEIRKASQKLDAMSLDEQERRYYEAQQKFWLDQNTLIKEAVEQAELRKQIEMAKNAISEGFDNLIISKLTGLTTEQIEQLRVEVK